MKYAIIDVGTNNVLFLIAEFDGQNIEVLHRDSNISALGKHMKNNLLSAVGIRRTKNILRDNIRFARMFTDKIIIVGTSCSREAANINELSTWLKNRFSLKYNIISGEKEALFNGLAILHEFTEQRNIVMFDVGGGSTEFTILQDGKVTFTQSLKLGTRRLDNEFSKDFEAKKAATLKVLQTLKIPKITNYDLIGIGGTVTSLSAYRYRLAKYKPDLIHKSLLSSLEIEYMLADFKNMTNDDISYLMPFDRYRADIIATGTMIVDEILKYLNKSEFIISDRGMQFGILLQPDTDLQKML